MTCRAVEKVKITRDPVVVMRSCYFSIMARQYVKLHVRYFDVLTKVTESTRRTDTSDWEGQDASD
jgi:hypothetical protein